jgi:hypothetical protein
MHAESPHRERRLPEQERQRRECPPRLSDKVCHACERVGQRRKRVIVVAIGPYRDEEHVRKEFAVQFLESSNALSSLHIARIRANDWVPAYLPDLSSWPAPVKIVRSWMGKVSALGSSRSNTSVPWPRRASEVGQDAEAARKGAIAWCFAAGKCTVVSARSQTRV